MVSSTTVMNICFNSYCKHVIDRSRKGWRRRSGDFADLCDPCASAYEEGRFCETFHLNAPGWRCCESCGKQIHCGCIVSFHMFVLLDAGGIECITCARKSFILTPNPAWPPSSHLLPLHSERTKDVSAKNWFHIAGSGPVPWRQAPSFFGSSDAQPDQRPRMSMEASMTSGIQSLTSSERLSVASFNKKKAEVSERLINGSLKLVASEKLDTGNAGINCGEQAKVRANIAHQSSFLKKDTHAPCEVFPISPFRDPTVATKKDTHAPHPVFPTSPYRDPTVVPHTHVPQPISPYLNGKQCSGPCETEPSGEVQTCNGKLSGDTSQRNPSFRRYWPRISDHELQQISGTSKSVITPLFEKTLSASDAGNLGRLILPKKCAEAYFPPISNAEGIPLNVHDSKGKEWTFLFRFWPNNRSRMYVLEGVYPCIHSMNLQAGDVVTFNRVEPEGRLVMGFRKASTTSQSNQDNGFVDASNGNSTDGDDDAKKSEHGADQEKKATILRKDKRFKCGVREVIGAKSTMINKRKNTMLGSKSKRLRIEKDDPIQLELTWEQAQGLLRPPLNHIPSVVIIEEFEFEEYEDAPVIGRPTIIAMDNMGENIQWAQCEDCLKWRKVPEDASLSSRWTCSGNSWDPERSSCSIPQELTAEQLDELLTRGNQTAANANAVKQEPVSFVDVDGLVGLDHLANQDVGDANTSSSRATTTHPRHRPDCTCIICTQPPRGESPKHSQTCTCSVCIAVKRRFQTLLTKRENKQSETGAESPGQKLLPYHESFFKDEKKQASLDVGCSIINPEIRNDNYNDLSTAKSSLLPFKGQFDLNTRPEREEDPSPRSDSGGLMKLIQDTTERYHRQQIQSNSSNGDLSANFERGVTETIWSSFTGIPRQ